MGEPIQRLSSELLRDHPALAAFSRYIETHEHAAPVPAEIEVNYERPHDGIIMMNYVNRAGTNIYVARLDANTQLLELVDGHATGRIQRGIPEVSYGLPSRESFTGLCTTVKLLGGDREANAPCRDSAPTVSPTGIPIVPTAEKFRWTVGMETANWLFFEAWGVFARRNTLRGLTRGLNAQQAAEVSLPNLSGVRSGLLATAAGYDLSYFYLGDALGMSPNDHGLERRALGFGGGYGAYRGLDYLLRRAGRTPSLSPVSFTASLLSAELVEATLGRVVGESIHDPEGGRFLGHTLGFLLPQFWRIPRGQRMILAAEAATTAEAATASRFSGFTSRAGRWGGRVVLASFLADASYMGINYLSGGSAATGRENRILSRAADLQRRDLGTAASFGRGIAEFLAPSLTRRFLTSDSYVSTARADARAEADRINQGAESFLRHALLNGDVGLSTDPNFYTEVNWDWLRGDNALRDITTADGRVLPVAAVAEQLSDPAIYNRVVEGADVERLAAYIQRQFRGYHLTRSDAVAILGLISLHRARANLGELQNLASASEFPLAGMFDASGALRADSDTALLNHLFPDQHLSSDQVLALRRVALAARILELRAAGAPAATELAAYTAVGQRIGLVNAEGNLVDGEETALARAHYEGRPVPPSVPAPVAPTFNNSDFLRETMALGAAHTG